MDHYKILLVENDDDEQHFMKAGFEKAGGFTILAMLSNGDELMDWLEKNPDAAPDLVLSDLNMPGKNGLDIITELKKHPVFGKLPVVITSTSSTRSIIDRCLHEGAADYVVKPDTFIEYVPYVNALHERITEKKLLTKEGNH